MEYVSKGFWIIDSVSTMYLLRLGPALNSSSDDFPRDIT